MAPRDKIGEEPDAGVPLDAHADDPTRCAACLTTWNTVRREGRVGCAACYDAFREALAGVMVKVQRGDCHLGKTPRAAQKRARRGENLRKRRENQLSLLENRLRIALESEKFEEAAVLRDKIAELSPGL